MTTYTSTNARPCASCGQQRRCLTSCPDQQALMFGTIDLPDGTKHIYLASSRQDIAAVFVQDREEGLFTGVIEPLQPAEIAVTPRFRVRRIPVGGIVLVMLGLTLMALGFVMNEPLAWFIYDMIHK